MDIARVLEHVQYKILPHLTDIDKLRFNTTCKSLYNPNVMRDLVFDTTTKLSYQLANNKIHTKIIAYANNLGGHDKQIVSICVGHDVITIKSASWSDKASCHTKTQHIHTCGVCKDELFERIYKALSFV